MSIHSGLSLQSVKLTGTVTQETFLNRGVYLLVCNYNCACTGGGVMTWIDLGVYLGSTNGQSIAQKGFINWFGGSRNNLFLGQMANTFTITSDNTSIWIDISYGTNNSPVIFDNTNPIYSALNYLHFIKIA